MEFIVKGPGTWKGAMWVVYDRPKDYPDMVIARRWVDGVATSDTIKAPHLIGMGVVLAGMPVKPYPLLPGEDPAIVSKWVEVAL